MEETRKLRTDCVDIREAVQKLQNIADSKMFEHAGRGRLEQRVCEDLDFVRKVITDMNAEYKILTHQLEITSISKLKYYDEYPNMVRNFQKHSYETVMKCRKDFLCRLEMSLLGMKDQSRNLRQLKYYKKFLKDENKSLKVLVEQVGKDSEAVVDSLHSCHYRRTSCEKALSAVEKQVVAGDKIRTGIERETARYVYQWEQQKVLWHWRAYELEIVACEELDEKLANEKEIEEGKRLDVSMEKAVERLGDDVATLETELQRNTEVLEIQQKFASVTKQTDIVDDPTTISDMEQWISILTNTDENIALEHFQPALQQLLVRPNDEGDALEKEQVDEVLRQMYDGRFPKSDFCFDDFLPLFVESSAVSTPQSNSGIPEVLNSSKGEDRKQGVVAVLEPTLGPQRLRTRLTTMMDDERTLQNETKKIKWILVSKTKNLERIKDELSDITETNKRLEQACNEHHNALRNALDEENEVHEINTKKLKEINMITAREESVLEAVNEERQEITSVLSQVLSTGQREVVALSDATAVKVEQEEGLSSSLAVTSAELHLMQATIECSKAEWKQQRVLRKQVAENIVEVSERLNLFRDTYQKVSESLNHQKASSEKVLAALTERRNHILRLQAEAERALIQTLSSLETCRSNLEEIRRMNAEIVRAMSTATAAARNFSTRLYIDLEDLDKSVFAYKGFTRIVESYMPYINVQSQYAMRNSEALLRKINKSVREDGHHVEEMKRKTLFGEDISGQLEKLKSAGIEHHKRADFLRDLQARLVELNDFSTIATELSTLSKIQGEKFSDIATKFLPAFLALR